jgi:hypothetical protein
MMKMKSKRDRRPLLTQEAPVLSDQMPHGTVGEGEHQSQTINQSQKEQQQFQQQQEQTKKGSWKRLFGKGGGGGGGGGGPKRKEGVHSRYSSIDGGEGKAGDTSNNNELNPIVVGQSYSSTFDDLVENSQQQQQHGRLQSIDKQSSPRVSDKRDDATESNQSIMSGGGGGGGGGEPIKQQDLKNNGDNNNIHSTNPAAAQTPTSTASNNSGRNKNRSTSVRSSSKRMTPKAVDQLSPSLSSVMASGSITSPTSSAGGGNKRPTTTTSNSYQQQQENAQPQSQQLWSSTTATPVSNKMIPSTVVDTDVKKILSKPFGREHILLTEQTVSFKNNGSIDRYSRHCVVKHVF